VRIGLTLPSFVEDPDVAIQMALAAEAAEIDGVFVYDHLFRRGSDGTRRPALEGVALLGAIASATSRITVGAMVMRSWLRPAASLASSLASVARIAPNRVKAGIGAGDSESREENESFGLGFGTLDERIKQLEISVKATQGAGVSTWVGGTNSRVVQLAAQYANGWNGWGLDLETFSRLVNNLLTTTASSPFEISWGGLVAMAANDEQAAEKVKSSSQGSEVLVGCPAVLAERFIRYRDAGADWVVVGPLDSENLANAGHLGEVRTILATK